MLPRLAADAVVVFHLLFILFVVGGGLLVLRWHWLAALHLPAALWGVVVQFTGWPCPLTPLENSLRQVGAQSGYSGSFIDHYLIPVIYPAGLNRDIQLLLGVVVVAVNLTVYLVLLYRKTRSR